MWRTTLAITLLAFAAAIAPLSIADPYTPPANPATLPGVVGALGAPLNDPPTPAAEVMVLVAQALRSVDPKIAKTTRYLSLHDLPRSEWDFWTRLTAGHLNGLSRYGEIVQATLVMNEKKEFIGLIQIDTTAYDAKATPRFSRVYERLGQVDVFFHDRVEKEVEEEVTRNVEPYYYNGRWYTQRVYTEKKVKLVHGLSPWLTRDAQGNVVEKYTKALEYIEAKTGGTDVPVLYADWFLWQTAIQYKRDVVVKAGYYDFLGIENQKDFEEAVGYVEKGVDPERLVQIRASVANSGVVGEDVLRWLIHERGIETDYWRSEDVNQQALKDKFTGNAIRNLGTKRIYQAVEAFGNSANGWWLTGLFQGNIDANGDPNKNEGQKQDNAPDFIASHDNTAPGNDTRIHVNLSCLRCHVKSGMQDIHDWARNVLNSPPNALFGKYDQVKDLQKAYVSDLETHLESGRKRFDAAVLKATGWTGEQYCKALGKAWEERSSKPVTRARAARDLGVDEETLKTAFITYGNKIDASDWEKVTKESLKLDPVLATFRKDTPEPLPVTVWFDSIGLAQDALRGVLRKPVNVKGK